MRGYKALSALSIMLLLLAACGPNQPPHFETYAAVHGNTVALFIKASDPDNDLLTCNVDFGQGGVQTFPCIGLQKIIKTYTGPGTFLIWILVEDSSGNKTEKTLKVSVPSPGWSNCPLPQSTSAGAVPLGDFAITGVVFAKNAQYVPGRLLVKLNPDALVQLQSSALAGVQVLSQTEDGWVQLQVPKGEELQKAEKLVQEGLAITAQPVYRYRLLIEPNDQYYPTYQRSQFAKMNLVEGWDWLSEKACRPIVAVIDTGADLDHPDLSANLLPGYDFSDGDDDPSDEEGHGTMVTGIVGAVTNNSKGVAGSTHNLAYVLPLKVFPNATSDTIADAIRWAADAGAHLINLSLCVTDTSGHCADLRTSPDPYIENALQYAYNRGVIAVAASGNDGYNYVGYPASSAYTFAVGSVDASGNRSSFSNYGDDLDFVAPGENVSNTIPDDAYSVPAGGSGTSFATPYVVGELALYLGQYYALKGSMPSFSQAATCFQNNTNQASRNNETGFGIPQANQFLEAFDGNCYP